MRIRNTDEYVRVETVVEALVDREDQSYLEALRDPEAFEDAVDVARGLLRDLRRRGGEHRGLSARRRWVAHALRAAVDRRLVQEQEEDLVEF